MRRLGVSLIEIVVSMLIVGILLAVGVPAFKHHEESQLVATATEQLLSALKLVHSGRIGKRPDAADWEAGALVPITAGDETFSSNGAPPPLTVSFQLEQIAGGRTTIAQHVDFQPQVVVVMGGAALAADASVPDSCSALIVQGRLRPNRAVVFLPSGALFRQGPPQNVTITISADKASFSSKVPPQQITITPSGSISAAPLTLP